MPIRHHLMVRDRGVMLSDVQLIRSHPQALEQCSAFIKRLKIASKGGIKTEQTASTSSIAKEIRDSGSGSIAALASARAAVIYGLHILSEDCQVGGLV